MPRYRRNISWRALPRRLCAAVTLCAYVVTAFGIPLPAPAARARQAGEAPFPCQDHACGCHTAEQCWKSCCCFTPAQRWAWAKQQQVEPPDYAAPPTSGGWRTVRARDKDTPVKSCCSTKPAPAEPAPCSSGGCSHSQPSPDDQDTPTTAADTDSPAGTRWVPAASALKCRGLSTLWVSAGAAAPGAPPITWRPIFAPLGWVGRSDDMPISATMPPVDPPPRTFSV